MEGWIKLHRKFTDWEWFQDSYMVHLFIYLLLNANHKEGKWKGVDIERGTLITGRKKLSLATGISEQIIRTRLKKLEQTNEIKIVSKSTKELTKKSTSNFTIITICNYDNYQSEITPTNQEPNQETNHELTSNQPTTNQQLTTNKNDKKNKNEKNIKFTHIKKSENFFENFDEVEVEEIPILETEKEIPLQKSSEKKVSPIEDVFLNNLSKFQNDYPNTKRFQEICMFNNKPEEFMLKLLDEFIEDNRKSREHATKENYTYFYQSIDKHFFYWAKAKTSKPTYQSKKEQQSEIYKAINEGKSITEILGV